MEYNIIIEKTPDNWYIGQCEQLPEAMSQGQTLEELLMNMKEAIQLVVSCQKTK